MGAASSVADPGSGGRAAVPLPERLELPEEVVDIARRLEEAGYETWAVGGALRDQLLQAGGGDVDLATAASPEVVMTLFRHTVPVGVRHGTVGVLDRARRLHEVTTFRRDVITDGRHAVVEFGASLEDDLARRDFTINAIAYHPLRRIWADPFRGAHDLADGVIRAVGNPADRFREDYLRILRALRFAARFGFTIEPATWAAAREAAPGLAGLSAERVRDEWFKSLLTARSLGGLVRLWHDSGAAAVVLPELHPAWPGVDLPLAERDPVVLTVLGCRDGEAVLRRLKASGAEISRAEAMARLPGAPVGNEAREVRRWMAAVGVSADDLMALDRARTGVAPSWQGVVEAIRASGDATSRGQLAITGDDLREAGVAPGPAMGALLDHLLQAVLDDPALNTRERLLAQARAWR